MFRRLGLAIQAYLPAAREVGAFLHRADDIWKLMKHLRENEADAKALPQRYVGAVRELESALAAFGDPHKALKLIFEQSRCNPVKKA